MPNKIEKREKRPLHPAETFNTKREGTNIFTQMLQMSLDALNQSLSKIESMDSPLAV